MPFIVTTKHLTPDGLGVTRPNIVRAVATLEEAARAFVASVMDVPAGVDPLSTMSGQRVMSWDGLAPLRTELSDGTVIEVEPVTWYVLQTQFGWRDSSPNSGLRADIDRARASLIAAYNAAQET